MSAGDDAGLLQLMEEMKSAPEVYRPSAFWDQLSALGLDQLQRSGIENFKRTVNMAYFHWGVLEILRHQFLPVFARWCRRPRWQVLSARFPNYRSTPSRERGYHSVADFRTRLPAIASFGPISALAYRTYVAMLWEDIAQDDPLGLLSRLDEPAFGNPFLIHYGNRATSQDLCNSVHEFYSAGAAEAVTRPKFTIGELGGGYGRLAYVCLQSMPSASYCLIDIAPALIVAQEYLTRVFPNERVFRFRPFRRYDEVREEFESSRIQFLAAHQIELLPPKQFDLFVNTSSLHEMTWPQIVNYISQIDRLCRGRFYMKQWRASQARVNGLVVREHDYPIPTSWRRLYHRRHAIQRLFFEALYEVGAEGAPHLPRSA